MRIQGVMAYERRNSLEETALGTSGRVQNSDL